MEKKDVSDYFKKLGSKGGKATAKKYGKEHMKAIAKKGWKAGVGKKPRTK